MGRTRMSSSGVSVIGARTASINDSVLRIMMDVRSQIWPIIRLEKERGWKEEKKKRERECVCVRERVCVRESVCVRG